MNSSHGKIEQEGDNNNNICSAHDKYQYQAEGSSCDDVQRQHEPFGKSPGHYYIESPADGDEHDKNDDEMMQTHPYQLHASAPVVPDYDVYHEQQSYEEYLQYYYYVDQHPSHYAYDHQTLPDPDDPADWRYEYYDTQDGYYSTYHAQNHQYQTNAANYFDSSYPYAYHGEQSNQAAQHQEQQQQQSAVKKRWVPHSYTLMTFNDTPLVPQQPHPSLRPVRLPTPPPTTPYGPEKSPMDDQQTLSTGISLSDKQDPFDKTIDFLRASTKKASQPDFSSLWKQRPLRR